jgi:hypothetical protein
MPSPVTGGGVEVSVAVAVAVVVPVGVGEVGEGVSLGVGEGGGAPSAKTNGIKVKKSFGAAGWSTDGLSSCPITTVGELEANKVKITNHLNTFNLLTGSILSVIVCELLH